MPQLLFPITAVATATLLLGSAIQGFAQEKVGISSAVNQDANGTPPG